jgi:putative DNA primase/helicase
VSADPLDLIEARLHNLDKNPKRKGNDKLEAQCPAHDDHNPSFGVGRGTVRPVVLNCQAGCDPDAIMAALGLEWTDLGENTNAPTPPAEYIYVDSKGVPVYKVCRGASKKFWQQHITPAGDWVNGLKGVTPLPYHLDELVIALEHRRTVWIAEGEKDVDRLRAEGVCATCNSGGAGSWKAVHSEWFNGADVVIVADKDEPGEAHAASIAEQLTARGCTVRIVRAAAGKDAFDHLAAGFTLKQFIGDGEEEEQAPAWPAPTELGPDTTPPAFPTHVLPAWIRDHAASQANAIQAPIDLTCILGIGAVSVATLGRIKVTYPWDDWTQPCSLYAVVAVPPSVGKSPAKSAMFGPLEEYEQERMDAARKVRRAHQDKIDVVTNKIASHKKAMIKDDSFTAAGLLDDYNADLYDLEAQMPPTGRLMADDATIEALGMVLADSGGSIGVVSAEGGLFDRLAGLYNENGVNLDLYLEGWSGGKYTVDRVKREQINIPRANVAVITTVQPTTIDDIGAKKVFAARGLVARFLMSMPNCSVGYRDRKRKVRVDKVAQQRYAVELTSIARYYADTETEFTLSEEACDLFSDWDQVTEYRLQPGSDLHHIDNWIGKLRANVLRLSAILHIAHGRDGNTVGMDSVAEAIELAAYYTDHMLLISERWGADAVIAKAKATAQWLERKALEEFSIRDLYNANRRLFESPDDTIGALQVLTDSGHIRPLFDGAIVVGRGGKPSPRFAVNPAVCAVRTVRPGAGESGSVCCDPKRGFETTFLPISDTSPHPDPDRTVRTAHTGPTDAQVEDDPTPPPTVVEWEQLSREEKIAHVGW